MVEASVYKSYLIQLIERLTELMKVKIKSKEREKEKGGEGDNWVNKKGM